MPPSSPPSTLPLSLSLAPSGRVHASCGDARGYPVAAESARRIEGAFARGTGHGLLHLGAQETSGDLGPTVEYWRDFAGRFVTRLCTALDIESEVASGLKAPLPEGEAARLLDSAPAMLGIEYLSEDVLRRAWEGIAEAFLEELRASGGSAEAYLSARNPLWSTVGRVFFHLAENRSRPELPFAFLATYTSRISAQGKVQHLPLGRALQESASAADRSGLLALLVPVRRAAEESAFLRDLVDSRRIFQTLAWSPDEAHRFLREVPLFEAKGIFVRVPDWWNPRSPPRLRVSATVGSGPAAGLGTDALLDFSVELSLEGERISEAEWRRILEGTGGLALVKGRWVEVDREKLRELLRHWKSVERQAGQAGLSFIEGMRLLARLPRGPAAEGAPSGAGGIASDPSSDWLAVGAGAWLRKVLEDLRRPHGDPVGLPAGALGTTLRPYQVEGVRWLWHLHKLRLGGCLADDMGLGKTVQVLALLLLIQSDLQGERESPRGEPRRPALLVIPASVIGNWKSECARFAPGLKVLVAHPSELEAPLTAPPSGLDRLDLVVTTYGMLSRQPWLREVEWGAVVLDEAQAIKNPSARQTQAVKGLRSRHRLALTGTPVENRLSDLWSLFDFLNPGLLGSAREFARMTTGETSAAAEVYGKVRGLVKPYLLRRLKTDKRVIADLPDKQEVKVYCGLRKTQAVHYQEAVGELARSLRDAEGIQRRGIILAFITRFKQICNHPSQWTGDGAFDPEESGKMARLGALCEEVASRQEKALVFTQYQELTEVLASFLETTFSRAGVVLDGDTPVKKRKDLVDAFQREDGPPFFVLSLRAGGTGLNLTAASHVIHFDRWWNPAVENQATDRAYRIGQKRNVLVHKFVCQGTVEEKIDSLIESKQGISDEVLRDGAEAVLTEMGDEELIRFVSIDTKRAVAEG